MQFGILYQQQLPRPWTETSEQKLFTDALEQIELADRLGLDYAWAVEHHFLEEYSHSSAPEVFLGAASQRTSRIRLGHGVVLMPHPFNHPAKVASRIATLDLLSGGRVEFGTGEAGSRAELEGFGVPREQKYHMWREAVEQTAEMLALDPYPGYEGRYFSMPCRNVLPKPVQKPHPPLWMACSSREAIRMAARHGLGALTYAFVNAEEARSWVNEYYTTFQNECVPLGRSVNPNIAMVIGFSCHEDAAEARRRAEDGFRFFGYSLAHHYVFGAHRPGTSNIYKSYEEVRDVLPDNTVPRGMDTPEQHIEFLREYEDAGVDQIIFIQQAGNNRHEHICESLELFAGRVLPEFQERESGRQAEKRERLQAHIDAALERREFPAAPEPEVIPAVEAYGKVANMNGARSIGHRVQADRRE